LGALFAFADSSGANLRHFNAKAHVALVPIVPIAMVFTVFVAEMRLALVRFVAFVRPMARFPAIGAEVLDSFVIAPFGVGDAAIAIVPIVGFCGWRHGRQQEAESRGG
jgi:hypothetical protein